MLFEISNNEKYGLIEKTPPTIGKLNFKEAVINWIRLTAGIGLFQLPFLFKEVGLILGIIFLIFGGFITYYSCRCILVLSHKKDSYDFEKIINSNLNKFWIKLFNLFLILDIGLTIMLNIVIAWKQIEYILNLLGYTHINDNNLFIFKCLFFTIILITMFPFFLKKEINNFQTISNIFLITLLTIIIVIICQFPIFYKNNLKNYDSYPIDYFCKFNKKTIIYLSNIALCMYLQPLILDLKKEIKNQEIKNMKKICKVSITIQIFANALIGIFGYLSIGNHNMPELINNRKPVFNNDYIMLFLNLLFAFFMIIGIPVFNISFRNYFYSFFEMKPNKFNFKYFSILPILSFAILGIIYPKVINLFSILGSVVCNFIGFILVFRITLKYKSKKNFNYYLIWVFYLFSIFLFFYFIIITWF